MAMVDNSQRPATQLPDNQRAGAADEERIRRRQHELRSKILRAVPGGWLRRGVCPGAGSTTLTAFPWRAGDSQDLTDINRTDVLVQRVTELNAIHEKGTACTFGAWALEQASWVGPLSGL